jgi:hypothetical protein
MPAGIDGTDVVEVVAKGWDRATKAHGLATIPPKWLRKPSRAGSQSAVVALGRR